ncbi:hypothetical protein LT493_32425 [Streptomyces tricolor]|nr:hypothetical protein [Streptomyces tricolor]
MRAHAVVTVPGASMSAYAQGLYGPARAGPARLRPRRLLPVEEGAGTGVDRPRLRAAGPRPTV